MFNQSIIDKYLNNLVIWLEKDVFEISTLSQLFSVLLIYFLSSLLFKKYHTQLENFIHNKLNKRTIKKIGEDTFLDIISPIINMILAWSFAIIADAASLQNNIIEIYAKLVTAWVVITFAASFVTSHAIAKTITIIAWVIAALSVTNLLSTTISLLDGFAFNLGEVRFSLLTLIKGAISLIILLWIAGILTKYTEKNINKSKTLTPSIKVLINKTTKISLIALAILIGINSIGIDLTALAVFGGAIGLGIGFGLQKVVSNLISGIILLLDRSVKPGDVIEVGSTYGWVNSLSARYVSVLTRDGVEHLIPNEHLITEKVVNWSYTSNQVRLKIPIGVSYESDLHKAMDIIGKVATSNNRVLVNPEPVVRLIEFGDSAINLELRIWIEDPTKGVINVRSDILVKVWDEFKKHKIEIPYPQRDLHIKTSEDLKKLLASNNKSKK